MKYDHRLVIRIIIMSFLFIKNFRSTLSLQRFLTSPICKPESLYPTVFFYVLKSLKNSEKIYVVSLNLLLYKSIKTLKKINFK